MSTIAIRHATINDLDVLLEFEQGVIATEQPFDPSQKPGKISYYDIPVLINSGDVELLVAETNDRVIASGYARIEESKPYHRHSHHAYLGFMYVVPEWRGKGINQMILARLEEWARSRGMTELRLEVFSANQPAQRAYEKWGFAPYMLQMRKGI